MVDSTRNVKVPITDSEDELQIGFNYSDYAGRRWEHALEAVYVSFGNGHNDEKFGPLSIENAILVRDKLTEIIDTYEAVRPKVQTEKEFWGAQKIGSVFLGGNGLLYIKVSSTQISFADTEWDEEESIVDLIESRTSPVEEGAYTMLFEGVA